MRKITPELEEALGRLEPKDAARIRKMSARQLRQEEHKLTLKMRNLEKQRQGIDQLLEKKTQEIRDLEAVIEWYENPADRHHRMGGRR